MPTMTNPTSKNVTPDELRALLDEEVSGNILKMAILQAADTIERLLPIKCPMHGFVRHADCSGCPDDAPSQVETTEGYKPKVMRLAPSPEQCAIARASALYQAGDVIVIAIGEGDCLMYCEELPQPSIVETKPEPGPMCAVCDHIEEMHRTMGASHAFTPKASACPKCEAVRKLGLTSCFEHKQSENGLANATISNKETR